MLLAAVLEQFFTLIPNVIGFSQFKKFAPRRALEDTIVANFGVFGMDVKNYTRYEETEKYFTLFEAPKPYDPLDLSEIYLLRLKGSSNEKL